MSVKFNVGRPEADTIDRIVSRAERLGLLRDEPGAHMTLGMDITATHANGCPLDLAGLLDAEDFDFAHDVAGIQRHIDRRTGALLDCFLPRYAARAGQS